MPITVEKFIASLVWETDTKELDDFDKQAKEVTDTIKGVGLAIAAAAAAAAAWMGITNRQTAVANNNAKAVGLSIEAYKALEGAFKGLGFEGDKVVDLMEEMNNKLGERKALGALSSVDDAFIMLGIRFRDIQNLRPEQQFNKILDVATRLADPQIASSAVDMLMGGDANKMLGHLRSLGLSMTQLVKKQEKLNFLSQEGADGATRWDANLTLLTSSISSISAEIAGLLGEALSPLNEATLEWIENNRELIKTKIVKFVKAVSANVKKVIGFIDSAVDSFGGWENVLSLVKKALIGIVSFKIISGIFRLVSAMKALAAAKLLLNPTQAIAGGLALGAALFGEDLWNFFTDQPSNIGAFLSNPDAIINAIGRLVGRVASKVTDIVGKGLGFDQKQIDSFKRGFVDTFVWVKENVIEPFIKGLEVVITTLNKLLKITKDPGKGRRSRADTLVTKGSKAAQTEAHSSKINAASLEVDSVLKKGRKIVSESHAKGLQDALRALGLKKGDARFEGVMNKINRFRGLQKTSGAVPLAGIGQRPGGLPQILPASFTPSPSVVKAGPETIININELTVYPSDLDGMIEGLKAAKNDTENVVKRASGEEK